MLDHRAYPHLIALSIDLASPKTLRLLRLCSREMKDLVAKRTARHICFFISPVRTEPIHHTPSYEDDRFPPPLLGMQISPDSAFERTKQLLRMTKTLDLLEWRCEAAIRRPLCNKLWIHILEDDSLPSLKFLRKLDSDCPIVARRIIDFSFPCLDDVPDGCEVFVINTRFSGEEDRPRNLPRLPHSVKQVVIHLGFTSTEGETSSFAAYGNDIIAGGVPRYLLDNSGPDYEDEERRWIIVGAENEPRLPDKWRRCMHELAVTQFYSSRPVWWEGPWTRDDALQLARRITWRTANEYKVDVGEWLYAMEKDFAQ